MRRGRITGTALGVGLAALVAAGGASSATPRQIYADLAQHGKLTQHYSAADLARARQDASVQGYGSPVVVTILPAATSGTAGAQHITGVTGTQKTVQQRAVVPAAKTAGTLPFTGLQLTLFVAIGLALVGGGLLLRRTSRRKPSS
jgi:hypothetical protein